MKLEELEYLVKEACDSYGCGFIDIDHLPEQITEVDVGDWDGGDKYQHHSSVYKCDQGNHFMIHNSRSGSYFTSYEYGQPSVQQVKPVVETITRVIWKAV